MWTCRPQGFDLLGWITDTSATPELSYLCSAPVSYAAIFAAQIAHYAVALKLSGVTQAQMLSVLKAATGHSQGVVAAAVISSAATDEDLVVRAALAAKYMLWQGTRCQQVLNATVTYSGMSPDASPMLAVSGLSSEKLGKAVGTLNKMIGAEVAVRFAALSASLSLSFSPLPPHAPTTESLARILIHPSSFYHVTLLPATGRLHRE